MALQLRIDERRNIGRELHDSTAQLLVALQLNIGCLKEQFSGASDGHRLLLEIDDLLLELHREVRAAAAIVPEAPFRGRDFIAALSAMAANFSRLTRVEVAIAVQGVRKHLAAGVETALYRIAQEALANAARHGRADRVSIHVRFDKPGPVLVVEDDGIGIGPSPATGIGMSSIRERVDELGGLLLIQRLIRGTRISVSIPRTASG